MIKIFSALVFLAISPLAMAFDELKKLEGSTVILTGDMEKVSCPIFGKYDCLTFPNNLHKFKLTKICFTANLLCSYGCYGFVAEKRGIKSMYVLGSALNGGLDQYAFTQAQCPSEF